MAGGADIETVRELANVVHSLLIVTGILICVILLIIVGEAVTFIRWLIGRYTKEREKSRKSKKSHSVSRSRKRKRRSIDSKRGFSKSNKSSKRRSKKSTRSRTKALGLKESMSGIQCGEHKGQKASSQSASLKPTTRSVETFDERSLKENNVPKDGSGAAGPGGDAHSTPFSSASTSTMVAVPVGTQQPKMNREYFLAVMKHRHRQLGDAVPVVDLPMTQKPVHIEAKIPMEVTAVSPSQTNVSNVSSAQFQSDLPQSTQETSDKKTTSSKSTSGTSQASTTAISHPSSSAVLTAVSHVPPPDQVKGFQQKNLPPTPVNSTNDK